ncbi:hypothetical protein TNCV_411541 [Trichonephila clavipes]|nr:hypothetical protein TNCV_411541 [Trichonephila clavipes]
MLLQDETLVLTLTCTVRQRQDLPNRGNSCDLLTLVAIRHEVGFPKDLVIVNAWLLYKSVETDKKSENKKKSNEFTKIPIIMLMPNGVQYENAKRGRLSNTSIEQMFLTKRCKETAQSIPCKDIRRDGVNQGCPTQIGWWAT